MELRIRYRDTDCTGRIFFPKYLEFFDDAILEFFRKRGINCTSLGGFVLDDARKEEVPVIGDCYCRFLEETFFDDILQVKTEVESLGEKKIVFRLSCYNKTRECVSAEGRVTLIYMNLETRKSTPLPGTLLRRLRDNQETGAQHP